MNLPPIPDDWQTDWHLAVHMDTLADGNVVEVTLAGIALHVSDSASGPVARSDERSYPVMVVDDEVFVLLSDAPD